MALGGVGFLVAVVGVEHVHENALTVDGVVERLSGTRSVGMLRGVLLVQLGFLFGTLLLTLPVAAELVVEQFEGGHVGLARVREELDDLLHLVFADLGAHVGVALLGRWTGLDISLLNLPFDIGGAPGGFGGERRILK